MGDAEEQVKNLLHNKAVLFGGLAFVVVMFLYTRSKAQSANSSVANQSLPGAGSDTGSGYNQAGNTDLISQINAQLQLDSGESTIRTNEQKATNSNNIDYLNALSNVQVSGQHNMFSELLSEKQQSFAENMSENNQSFDWLYKDLGTGSYPLTNGSSTIRNPVSATRPTTSSNVKPVNSVPAKIPFMNWWGG